MEQKGTIEEKHAHIETLELVGNKHKTHYGENPCKYSSNRLSSNHSSKESTLIHIFKKNYNNHEIHLNIKTLIQMALMYCHCL